VTAVSTGEVCGYEKVSVCYWQEEHGSEISRRLSKQIRKGITKAAFKALKVFPNSPQRPSYCTSSRDMAMISMIKAVYNKTCNVRIK